MRVHTGTFDAPTHLIYTQYNLESLERLSGWESLLNPRQWRCT